MSDRDAAAKVEVVLELAEGLPPVLGDPEQLQQVLLNLSVNALQVVGPAGRVVLRTLPAAWAPEPGRLYRGGGRRYRIQGFPAHDLPHIFEPFFTTKGVMGGTGLGLTISREIVRSHYGEIRVESRLGQETRFIVSLPPGGR